MYRLTQTRFSLLSRTFTSHHILSRHAASLSNSFSHSIVTPFPTSIPTSISTSTSSSPSPSIPTFQWSTTRATGKGVKRASEALKRARSRFYEQRTRMAQLMRLRRASMRSFLSRTPVGIRHPSRLSSFRLSMRSLRDRQFERFRRLGTRRQRLRVAFARHAFVQRMLSIRDRVRTRINAMGGVWLGALNGRRQLTVGQVVKRIFSLSLTTRYHELEEQHIKQEQAQAQASQTQAQTSQTQSHDRATVRMIRPNPTDVLTHWRRVMHMLVPLGGVSLDNQVTVFADGDLMFRELWYALEHATQSIKLESYTLEPDAVGEKTMFLLLDACKRGVQVTVIYDSWGSSNLVLSDNATLKELEKYATMIQFNPIIDHAFRWRRGMLFRNHRKICIIDDQLAFVGGMNVAVEYCSPLSGGNGKFRDTHCKVRGPAVEDLNKVFYDSYQEAIRAHPDTHISSIVRTIFAPLFGVSSTPAIIPNRHPINIPLSSTSTSRAATTNTISSDARRHIYRPSLFRLFRHTAPIPVELPIERHYGPHHVWSYDTDTIPHVKHSGIFVQILKSNVWKNKRLIQEAMKTSIRAAQHRCYITNPYFIPSRQLTAAITSAARRGVDVRCLVTGPGRCDVPIMRWASHHIYGKLLAAGIRIYEYENRTLHAKTVSIDGLYASVGSFNFDLYSSVINLEVNLTTLDPDMAHSVESQFMLDLKHAKEITAEEMEEKRLGHRIFHWCAYQIACLAAGVRGWDTVGWEEPEHIAPANKTQTIAATAIAATSTPTSSTSSSSSSTTASSTSSSSSSSSQSERK